MSDGTQAKERSARSPVDEPFLTSMSLRKTLGMNWPTTWPMNWPTTWNAFVALCLGAPCLALFDQAIVSGASFVATVLVGRLAGMSELGQYSIGLSILVSALAIQNSLLCLPYAIQRHASKESPANDAGALLIQNLVLSIIFALGLGLCAKALSVIEGHSEIVEVGLSLATISPFILFRELVRRYLFAHLFMRQALLLDAATAMAQIVALMILSAMDSLSAVNGFAALGISSALPSLVWLLLSKRQFAIEMNLLTMKLSSQWRFARWLVFGQIIVQVQSYAPYWMSMTILGSIATGTFAASMSVAALINPIVLGLTNILTAQSALAWAHGGARKLMSQAIQCALVFGIIAGLYLVFILLAGDGLVAFLYNGHGFDQDAHLPAVLVLALLLEVIGAPASNALASMQRPQLAAQATLIGAIVTIASAWCLLAFYGLPGIAYGMAIGNAIGSWVRWLIFMRATQAAIQTERIRSVLNQFGRPWEIDHSDVALLGKGDDALAYLVSSRQKKGAPEERPFVVKMFREHADVSPHEVHAQFRTMSTLRARLDGQSIEGWTISVPDPLCVYESPLAIVMTHVPGRNMKCWTSDGWYTGDEGQLTPTLAAEIGRVTVLALQKAWRVDDMHGDFALQNLMCDIKNKYLYLIDPGQSCPVCIFSRKKWPPSVRDLGHLTSDISADVKRFLCRPAARARSMAFLESALDTHMQSIAPGPARFAVAAAIRDCLNAHYAEDLPTSVSPRGIWRGYVRWVATYRANSLLAKWLAEDEFRGEDPVCTTDH